MLFCRNQLLWLLRNEHRHCHSENVAPKTCKEWQDMGSELSLCSGRCSEKWHSTPPAPLVSFYDVFTTPSQTIVLPAALQIPYRLIWGDDILLQLMTSVLTLHSLLQTFVTMANGEDGSASRMTTSTVVGDQCTSDSVIANWSLVDGNCLSCCLCVPIITWRCIPDPFETQYFGLDTLRSQP